MGLEIGSGAGDRLPTAVLAIAGVSTVIAVVVSAFSIYLHLKNYRKPFLQRMVIRIMIMVPIYAIASLISIFSVQAAFVIDALRDIYEAFVIYCFFVLLLDYLGGERSLLILLHGRPPIDPVFPASIFQRELDVSDPYTFLFLKRGILQYVQVKPLLAVATLILKALGKYNEGNFRVDSGYLYISIVYNTSICLALYCLAVFWMCVNDDLKPFRPVPKFLCVKGILFFCFWQSIMISILVSAGAINKLGPYTDPEHISVALTDTLICIEMPFFAIAHLFAFSFRDFMDPNTCYVARMPVYYAIRDAFGLLDVLEDSKATLRGENMDYREFEPSEGFMHQGLGRDRRIRAGLRYSKGGKRKYWLPRPDEESAPPGRVERGVNNVIKAVAGRDQAEGVYAPLLGDDADDTVHLAPDMIRENDDILEDPLFDSGNGKTGYELPFEDPDEADEEAFEHSRKYLFGDYNYPCIDVSSETARREMRTEEERILRDERGALFSPMTGAKGVAVIEQRPGPAWQGYGAVGTTTTSMRQASTSTRPDLPQLKLPHHQEYVIDHGAERIPPPEASKARDVKLKWTKSKSRENLIGRPGSSSSRQNSTSRPSTSTSQARLSTTSPPHPRPGSISVSRSTSSNLLSRSNSNNTNTPTRTSPPKPSTPILPPDAVDLVVEDDDAAQEQLSRDRRKGEPAVRNNLRKVYRRGFVTTDEEGRKKEGEIEVVDPKEDDEDEGESGDPSARERRTLEDQGEGRVEKGEEVLSAMGDEGEDADMRNRMGSPEFVGEETIARVETPPLHARVWLGKDEEHNPWA